MGKNHKKRHRNRHHHHKHEHKHRDFHEEFAVEIAPEENLINNEVLKEERLDSGDEEMQEVKRVNAVKDVKLLGIAALVLSILAFIYWPFILASAAIILGIIAAQRGSFYGWWAVAISLIALIIPIIKPMLGF